jgi:hypothetical protein
MDTAQNASKSLDLLRQIVQDDINRELRIILDRYMSTTFSVAMDNLRRNGVTIGTENVNELCRNILEAAKLPFSPPIPVTQNLGNNAKLDSYGGDNRMTTLSSADDSIGTQASHPTAASYLANKVS